MSTPKPLVATATNTVVELMIEETSTGCRVPILQHFQTTGAPRVGETIEITDVNHEFYGEYKVQCVRHSLSVGYENRHTIWVEVIRIK
jgi:hypothetical protein